MTKPEVFISYSRVDLESARVLAASLRGEGCSVWMDVDELSAGMRWKLEIRRAIKRGAAIVLCFSTSVVSAERSYVNEEMLQIIEELRLRPAERRWLFLTRFDDVQIPDRSIGGGEFLSDLQYFDLFPDLKRRCDLLAHEISLYLKTLR